MRADEGSSEGSPTLSKGKVYQPVPFHFKIPHGSQTSNSDEVLSYGQQLIYRYLHVQVFSCMKPLRSLWIGPITCTCSTEGTYLCWFSTKKVSILRVIGVILSASQSYILQLVSCTQHWLTDPPRPYRPSDTQMGQW